MNYKILTLIKLFSRPIKEYIVLNYEVIIDFGKDGFIWITAGSIYRLINKKFEKSLKQNIKKVINENKNR